MATTGSIQTKGGKYYAVINIQNANGKRKQKWINTGLPVRGNKKKAEKFLEQQIGKYSTNCLQSSDILFADYLESWLVKIEDGVRKNTYRSYKGNMENHIIPYFKEKKIWLQQVCPVTLEEYYDKMIEEGLSATTVRHHHQNISKALSDAVHDQLIIYNPATKAASPKPKKFKAKFLTPSQLAQLSVVVKNDVIELPVKLCAIYGFRRSEVLGLRWSCIDFNAKTISVEKTLQQHTGGSYTDEPKTESSRRVLPLTDAAYAILSEHRAQQEQMAEILGDNYHHSDYVCTWADGKVIQPNYLTKKFHKILMKSNLPVIRLHDLRHSIASNLINETDASIVKVSEWLGHSSPEVTLRFYSHINCEQKKEVAKSIDKMLHLV